MRQCCADLWQTEVESPFPGLTTHAYLLTRDSGNVLFYNTSQAEDLDKIADLGGIDWQLLSHRDELGESIVQIRERFGARLGGHINERDEFAKFCQPDKLFSRRETILDNIDVIPTPGHTPGSCCFQLRSPTQQTYLFTGDTLYLSDEGWKPGRLSFSEPDDLAESLALLQTLQPDIVFSSAFSGERGYEKVTGNWSDKVAQAMLLLQD